MQDLDSWCAEHAFRFRMALASNYAELTELQGSGVAARTIMKLYPAEFEPASGLEVLPQLIATVNLAALTRLLDSHARDISSGWKGMWFETAGSGYFTALLGDETIKIVLDNPTFRHLSQRCYQSLLRRDLRTKRRQILGQQFEQDRKRRAQALAIVYFYHDRLFSMLPKAPELLQTHASDLLGQLVPLLESARAKLEKIHTQKEVQP